MTKTDCSGSVFRKLVTEARNRKLVTEARNRKRRPSGRGYENLLSYEETEQRPVAPRGYVPILVGGCGGEEVEERFLVHVRMLRNPGIAGLLQKAAEEYGYAQEGVLRIPCGVEKFRRTVELIA